MVLKDGLNKPSIATTSRNTPFGLVTEASIGPVYHAQCANFSRSTCQIPTQPPAIAANSMPARRIARGSMRGPAGLTCKAGSTALRRTVEVCMGRLLLPVCASVPPQPGPCKQAWPVERRKTVDKGGRGCGQPRPADVQRPQTSREMSTIMASLAHCSSSASTLPSSVEAKPHWGERQS